MHITNPDEINFINNGNDLYEGSALKGRFAYKVFRKNVSLYGNIVAFVAPMEVTFNLVDLEDALANDFIYSDSAINFLIELPNYSIEAGICFQRLFNTALGSLLASKYLGDNISVNVDGDDIMVLDKIHVEPKKASVSIAKHDNGAVLIHTGINIEAGERAPSFAYSTKLSKEETNQFIKEAIDIFNHMTKDIFVATTKLIS
jgi:hypothetical protein